MAQSKSSKRRSNRKSKKSKQRTTNVNKSLQPIASRYICKTKYATTIATSSGIGQYIFNLNSLFDPDRTGIGHQPYGYDTLSTMYNRYRVISCSYRVNQSSASTGTPVVIGAMPSNDQLIVFTNMGEMIENPRAKYVAQNVGGGVTYLTGNSYIPALMGRNKAQYMADDQYGSVVTGSPGELALLYLQTFNGFDGTNLGGIGLHVVLEFVVEWYDVKHQIQS